MLQELQLPRQQSSGLIYHPYCWSTLHPKNPTSPSPRNCYAHFCNQECQTHSQHVAKATISLHEFHTHALEEKGRLSPYTFSLLSTSWAYFRGDCDRRSGLTGPHQSSESTNVQLWFSLSPALHTTWKVSKRDTQIYGKLNDVRVYLSGQDYRDLRNSSTFSFLQILAFSKDTKTFVFILKRILSAN